MKNKAFTLIELLAVIVILAIIALIATPIILGIINSTRSEARERSAEAVAHAVETAYMQTAMKAKNNGSNPSFTNNDVIKNTKVENEKSRVVDDEDEDPSITTKDGVTCTLSSEFILGCLYNDENLIPPKNIKTGKDLSFKPQYYIYDFAVEGLIGELEAPDGLTSPPEGKRYYLGYDVENGKVSAAYSCFKRDGNEYCLKGGDGETSYEKNSQIIRYAYSDLLATTGLCNFNANAACHDATGLGAGAQPNGRVGTNGGNQRCYVDEDGYMQCYQYRQEEEVKETTICALISGSAKTVGSAYICGLDTYRVFYVLGENSDSSKIDLIMDRNFTDSVVPTTMAWCDQDGSNPTTNACNHDGLDPYVNHIQDVFDKEKTNLVVNLPSAERLVSIEGYSSVQAYANAIWPTLETPFSNRWLVNQQYWTSTPSPTREISALRCGYSTGFLVNQVVDSTGTVGLRPVITISKTLLYD